MKTNRLGLLSTISVCALTPTLLSAQARLTIPQSVERMRDQLCRPGKCEPYATSRVRELAPYPFDRAVRESDLIVFGSLKKLTTYLSTSEMELYTDYELFPTNVISDRQGRGARTATAPQRLIVRQWGGETVINGVPVILKDENIPFLPVNAPLLLLLSYNASTGKYDVYDGGSGAFQVDSTSTLRHIMVPEHPTYERFKGMKAADAIREIHTLGR
jgi:hypothetical protein